MTLHCVSGCFPLPQREHRFSVRATRLPPWPSSRRALAGPEDIDFVEVPDNSSWHYLQHLEMMGFCGPGEAEQLLDEDDTIIGGKLPVRPSGGASSFEEAVAAQGLLQTSALAEQLRGQVGPRQVEGAKVGMGQAYGQLGNSASAILKV